MVFLSLKGEGGGRKMDLPPRAKVEESGWTSLDGPSLKKKEQGRSAVVTTTTTPKKK